MSVMTMAVVWAAEADIVKIPVELKLQSSPPVIATVVDALVLPILIVSPAVPSVAILTVSVPELVTPPMSIVFVDAESERLTVLVTAAVPKFKVVEVDPATGVSKVTIVTSLAVVTRK